MLALAFLSVCKDSFACACVSQCLYRSLCSRLRFSVFLRTLVPCTCVSQCSYGLLCLRLRSVSQCFSRLWILPLCFSLYVVSPVETRLKRVAEIVGEIKQTAGFNMLRTNILSRGRSNTVLQKAELSSASVDHKPGKTFRCLLSTYWY